MADKEGETFDEAVEERVINEEYKVGWLNLIVRCLDPPPPLPLKMYTQIFTFLDESDNSKHLFFYLFFL